MKPVKIVVIGAGSVTFGLTSLCDAVQTKELRGSELVFVDIHEESLRLIASLAERMNREADAGLRIRSTMDRREALADADFVITSIAVNRDELWKQDWSIPLANGIRHVLGENGGPGGLSHALRNIPIILDICKDMEQLCPKALLINFSNPESRICMAVHKYTNIRAVGLCHGVMNGRDKIAAILGRDNSEIDVKAAGINHLVWFLDVRDNRTGEDLYPLLREREAQLDPSADPLTRALLRRFGYWPSPSDDHIGEYLPYGWEKAGLHGYDFQAANERRAKQWNKIRLLASGEGELGELLTQPSGEIAFDIIRAMSTNANAYVLAVNIPNNGCITNLPADAIVEVPALVSGYGIQGLAMGDLPPGIAGLCGIQVEIQKLSVDAAVHGDRSKALQALLIDPVIDSMEAAEKTLTELLSAHEAYLPRFARR